MIDLYSGTCGSGKSLHSADKIIWALRMKRHCICNFDVAHDLKGYDAYFHYVPNEKLMPNFLEEFSRSHFNDKRVIEDEILLIIDECQLLFNAREWNKSGQKEWNQFFQTHRHFGYHIILVAQFDRMIDRQIRSVIEYNYIHRKIANFGIYGKVLSLLFGGKAFLAVKYWYPINTKVGTELFHARKKLYRVYDSYAIFKG